MALVGHATGEWEEGGEGVHGGGRGKKKIQELAGRERRGGLLKEDTTRATIYRTYT